MHDEDEDVDRTQLARLHPQSALQVAPPPALCVFHELVATSGAFLRHVSAVDASWLARHAAPAVSRRALLAVCGRPMPDEDEGQKKAMRKHQDTEKRKKEEERAPRVTSDAVAAARARFLARKKRQR